MRGLWRTEKNHRDDGIEETFSGLTDQWKFDLKVK